jgi:ABC-type nitrate/sulfonate/bicarbonate transport system permease component
LVTKKRSPVNWTGFGFFLLCALIVEVLARKGYLTSYVPPPSTIVVALWQGLVDGEISSQILATMAVYVEGLVLATLLAITMGVLMGTYRPVFDALKVIVEFLRQMRMTVVTYAAFWPMLISTIYGVRAIDPQALDVARNFGVTGGEALWRVTFPSALASIATGFRVSATIALVVTITTELIAGNSGIGYYISQMEQADRLPPMYAAIILTGILGYLLNTLYFALEHKFVFWTPAARERAT